MNKARKKVSSRYGTNINYRAVGTEQTEIFLRLALRVI